MPNNSKISGFVIPTLWNVINRMIISFTLRVLTSCMFPTYYCARSHCYLTLAVIVLLIYYNVHIVHILNNFLLLTHLSNAGVHWPFCWIPVIDNIATHHFVNKTFPMPGMSFLYVVNDLLWFVSNGSRWYEMVKSMSIPRPFLLYVKVRKIWVCKILIYIFI